MNLTAERPSGCKSVLYLTMSRSDGNSDDAKRVADNSDPVIVPGSIMSLRAPKADSVDLNDEIQEPIPGPSGISMNSGMSCGGSAEVTEATGVDCGQGLSRPNSIEIIRASTVYPNVMSVMPVGGQFEGGSAAKNDPKRRRRTRKGPENTSARPRTLTAPPPDVDHWIELAKLIGQLANRVANLEDNHCVHLLTMWDLPMVDPPVETAWVLVNVLNVNPREPIVIVGELPAPRKGVLVRFNSRATRDYILQSQEVLTSHGISVGRV